MHVLLINQFFYPEFAATAQLATDLAQDLVQEGFRVTVIASRGAYLGGARTTSHEDFGGICIVRVAAPSFGKANLAHRLADYAAFFAGATIRTLSTERPDVLMAMSTPPLIGAIAALSSSIRGTRFVYWAQDLYPELAVALGVLKQNSIVTRVLHGIARTTLRRADAVITLGDRMADNLVARGATRERVHVIPNWADPASIVPMSHAANAFRVAQGLDGKRVVQYSGNFGRGHDLATVLAAAEELRPHEDIAFLFVGDGAKRSLIEAAARTNTAIRLIPYQPRSALSESLSAGDLHLVTQDANTEGLMEPSKLYGVMAVGRPILYVGPPGTEVASTLSRESIGKRVANGDVVATKEAILEMLGWGADPGERARAAIVGSYGRAARTAQIARLLRTLAA